MKVRLLQGNQAGSIEEWTTAEARPAIATGWCEAVVPAAPAPAIVSADPPKAKARKPKTSARRTAARTRAR